MKNIIKKVLQEQAFDITTLIKTLRNYYKNEYQCTLWDINNGLCVDFADDLVAEMGGENDEQFVLTTDMFLDSDMGIADEWEGEKKETEFGIWSLRLLDLYGHPKVPLEKIDHLPHHHWVCYNKKHYDAECPNGVNTWVELPIFKRFFNRINKK